MGSRDDDARGKFCQHRWLNLADIEDGRRPGIIASESGLRDSKPQDISAATRELPQAKNARMGLHKQRR